MNGKLKALISISPMDVAVTLVGTLLAYVIVLCTFPPPHLLAIFIGAFLGTRISNYIVYRRNTME